MRRWSAVFLFLLLPLLLGACNRPYIQTQPAGPEPATSGTASNPKHDPWPTLPRAHPQTRDLNESLALPEPEFDLVLSLLLFARDHGGATNDQVEEGLATIDNWQEELARRIRSHHTHEERADELRRFIHRELKFRFDAADPRGYDPDNLMFHRVLERRKGYCVTLSLLYVLLAPAARVEIAPIRLPGHFAVIETTGEMPMVLETTDFGMPVTRTALYAKFRMSIQSVETHGVFMAPVPQREVFSTLYSNLAALASLREDDAAALRHINRAIEFAPRNVEALYNRATLTAASGKPADVQAALADVNEALRLDPNFYRGYTRRAAIRGKWGDPLEADADLRKAFALLPNQPQAYIEQGVIRYERGDLTGARESFDAALARDSGNVDALRNLAVVERELGNAKKAEELERRWRAGLPKAD